MKRCEKDSLIILTKQLLKEYTRLLDNNCTNIDGELRIKLGIAESNLFKIAELLEKTNE